MAKYTKPSSKTPIQQLDVQSQEAHTTSQRISMGLLPRRAKTRRHENFQNQQVTYQQNSSKSPSK